MKVECVSEFLRMLVERATADEFVHLAIRLVT
jgi:hypothetical protein